ncbi:conserved hypothetical protein [Acidovorax delafieldii 2AN]|uniref:Uncharacterized protein n=1 Tax=Acidovorax delafieldii 2AN TaxID=573060 RepID=C5T1V1_ACIDE|nr:DUF6682 family protein [Acidovorax delafieldii]EER61546.1 conserved hypothetical protein [Acidovorax delafieldii 2AN]
MNVADFIATFRREMADASTPYMWSDEDIAAYLDEAVKEACERARLIEDSTTPAVTTLAVLAGQYSYTLHPSVIDLKRVTYKGKALTLSSVEAEDQNEMTWENRTGAEPLRYIYNGMGTLRLVPIPTQPLTVQLTVYRQPLKTLTADIDTAIPEIPAVFHPRLKAWIYRCAYLKQDADTFDKSKSEEFEAQFERAFGTRLDANMARKRRDRALPVVRSNW